ncbi:MAG: hypothetical protein QXE31_03780 [Candidatus Woesearchaeota archaeon]
MKLLKKVFGEFNYVAYFRFKFFPFSLFNILSAKEENVKKTVIKSMMILYLFFLILCFVIASIFGIIFVNNTYININNFQKNIYKITQTLSDNLFENEEPELQKTQVAMEINNKWQSIHSELINKNVVFPKNWIESLSYYFNGKVYEDMKNHIIFFEKFRLMLSDILESKKIVSNEYKWIKKNIINNTLFYDGSKSMNEHIEFLNNNVNYLYSKISEINQDDKNELINILRNSPFLDNDYSLFYKATNKLFTHLDIYKMAEKIVLELFETRQKIKNEIIKQEYNLNHQEKDIDKILALKLIEARIVKQLIVDCKDSECKLTIIEKIKDPLFCIYLTSNERDQCIINYAIYNKDICEEISNTKLKNDCLNK